MSLTMKRKDWMIVAVLASVLGLLSVRWVALRVRDDALAEMAGKGYDAGFLGETLPQQMKTGETVEGSVLVRNRGSAAWIGHGAEQYVALGLFEQSPVDWFFGTAGHGNLLQVRMSEPDGSVEGDGNRIIAPAKEDKSAPTPEGGEWRVEFLLTAPDKPGLHHMRLQMVKEGAGWFGRTLEFDVEVTS